MKFRIVKSGNSYYVQIRRWYGWRTAAGYHRGATGYFNYQFAEAANPYYHVKHTIPEILEEQNNPQLDRFSYYVACCKRRHELRKIDYIFDIQKIDRVLKEYLKTNPPLTEPFPATISCM